MADAVKQLYWAKQALEAPSRSRPAGRTEYYTWEDSGTTRDGRRLAPETVGVPVFIPSPVPAVPMTTLSRRSLLAVALMIGSLRTARGFLGIADTSFVTVIANPAEAANWAAELESLNSQLEAARSTLQTVGDLRAYAGDPRAALAALRDLNQISAELGALSSGAQTDADLLKAWQSLGASQRLLAAATLLQGSGAGATMQVFGRVQPPRSLALRADLAPGADASARMRGPGGAPRQAARSPRSPGSSRSRGASSGPRPPNPSKQAILDGDQPAPVAKPGDGHEAPRPS